MKDFPVTKVFHKRTSTTILQAEIDVGIFPLVRWLNSFHSIMTRWSCEGDFRPKGRCKGRRRSYSMPYITIWVDEGSLSSRSDFEEVRRKLASSSEIKPVCTTGEVKVFNIVFNSKSAMKRVQKEITK